jgi:hypothetical protein
LIHRTDLLISVGAGGAVVGSAGTGRPFGNIHHYTLSRATSVMQLFVGRRGAETRRLKAGGRIPHVAWEATCCRRARGRAAPFKALRTFARHRFHALVDRRRALFGSLHLPMRAFKFTLATFTFTNRACILTNRACIFTIAICIVTFGTWIRQNGTFIQCGQRGVFRREMVGRTRNPRPRKRVPQRAATGPRFSQEKNCTVAADPIEGAGERRRQRIKAPKTLLHAFHARRTMAKTAS